MSELERPDPVIDLGLRLAFGARGEAVAKFRQHMHERRQARIDAAWSSAVDDSGVNADELLNRINADERLSDLFATTMDAALRSRWQAKLRALGMALSRGVLGDSDTKVDALKPCRAHLRAWRHRTCASWLAWSMSNG